MHDYRSMQVMCSSMKIPKNLSSVDIRVYAIQVRILDISTKWLPFAFSLTFTRNSFHIKPISLFIKLSLKLSINTDNITIGAKGIVSSTSEIT